VRRAISALEDSRSSRMAEGVVRPEDVDVEMKDLVGRLESMVDVVEGMRGTVTSRASAE